MATCLEKSTLWRKANSLTLRLYKVTKTFPADDSFGMSHRLRMYSDQILEHLETGLLDQTYKENISNFKESLEATCQLRRGLDVSRYLGYLEEDSYSNLETEIDSILTLLSRQLLHLNHLNQSLNADIAYAHQWLMW